MNTCPTCQTTLRQIDYQQLTLLQCETCSGFWFREGQFRQVKAFGFSGLPGAPSEDAPDADNTPETSADGEPPSLACPDCDVLLMPYTYAYSTGIQLRRCPRCTGIWATYADLVRIERLLADYQESLEEAKSKAMPLMMQVKRQIQAEEQVRDADKRNNRFFRRVFRGRSVKSQPRPSLHDEIDANADVQGNDGGGEQ